MMATFQSYIYACETPLDTRKLKSQNEVFQPASDGRFQISVNTVFLLWIVIVPVYPFEQTSSDIKQMKSTHPVFCSSFIVSRTTNQILVMVSWYCLLSMFYTTNQILVMVSWYCLLSMFYTTNDCWATNNVFIECDLFAVKCKS